MAMAFSTGVLRWKIRISISAGCVKGLERSPTGWASVGGTAQFAARSQHTGGVHVLLGDGSSRFVSNNIDINTWRNLSTMADGQVISDF